MPIEEIVVRARRADVRTPEGVRPGDFRRAADRAAGRREGGAGPRVNPQKPRVTMTEIKGLLNPKRQAEERAINDAKIKALAKKLGVPVPKRPGAIPEIVVTAKRVGRTVRFGPLFGFATFVGDVGAKIAKEVSQQRLDESFQAFKNIKPRPKDSPVRTIEPERIPEIVVTGKRTPAPRLLPTALAPDLRNLGDQFLRDTSPGFPEQRPTAPEIKLRVPTPPPRKKPTLPGLLTFTKVPDVSAPGGGASSAPAPRPTPVPLSQPAPTPRARPGPKNVPRSILLGIGQPFTGTGSGPGPTGLTGFSPGMLTLTQPERVRAKRCPPCKKKKEKKRTKCYKQLVKQGTTSRQDKIFNLVEINCRTKKEIPKKRK